jgi:hypothetical protein
LALTIKNSAKAVTESGPLQKLPYRLQVVAHQLSLEFGPAVYSGFTSSDNRYSVSSPDSDGDLERDRRSESEWIDAVLSYLQFRSGSAWRRGKVRHRQSPRFWEYTDAIRLINEQKYKEQPPCNCRHCLPIYGRRTMKPIPALPVLYPGDKFFRLHPDLEPTFDSAGRYTGAKERKLPNDLLKKVVMVLVVAFFFGAIVGRCEDLPDAPAPIVHSATIQQLTGIPRLQHETTAERAADYSLWFGVLAVHTLDWTSTQQCLRRPYAQCHEGQLPVALVSNKAGFALFKAGIAFGAIEGQRYLERHGHRRLAYAAQSVHIGVVLAQDVYNYRLSAHDPRYEGQQNRIGLDSRRWTGGVGIVR